MEILDINDNLKINGKAYNFSGYGQFDTEEPKENDNRYYLEIILNDDNIKPVIVAFMINPSKTFSKTIDNTVKNLIRMTYKYYSKLIVLNLFSTIKSKPIGLEKNEQNNNFINQFLSKDVDNYNKIDILIACGHNKDKQYFEDIKDFILPYKNKFKKILFLSLNIEKFKYYIEDKVLHPSSSVINAYGGLDNLELKQISKINL